jgi:hypothetical protein
VQQLNWPSSVEQLERVEEEYTNGERHDLWSMSVTLVTERLHKSSLTCDEVGRLAMLLIGRCCGRCLSVASLSHPQVLYMQTHVAGWSPRLGTTRLSGKQACLPRT